MSNSYKKRKIDGIQYCIRCCMPETQEGIKFDEMGICQACQSSEQKIHINWVHREKQLREILEQAKNAAGNNYDCILPISGGKDSFFQAYVLTQIYKMNPLAVTFSHNWYSETGFYNLQRCLQVFNLDHIQYTPNRNLVNRLAKRSIGAIGDTCWHCHAGIGSFPLHIAVKFKIPLLIWGESIAEASGRASYNMPVHKFDREYFTKVSAKLTPKEMVCEYINEKELLMFEVPTLEECEAVGLSGIHLGDYIFWDDERQTEFIKKHFQWKETEMEGAYKKYKSAECIMAGMHDFTCYLKRGYGRATYQASVDIRNGLMTREEGFAISEKDKEIPYVLDYYLDITGLTAEEFYNVFEKIKVEKLKNTILDIRQKVNKHPEVLIPFVEQIIEKHLKKEESSGNKNPAGGTNDF